MIHSAIATGIKKIIEVAAKDKVSEKHILLRYNSLPCGTECFTGRSEALRQTSKKKRHLYLAVASGCRHVICPFCYNFSRWSPPSYNLWEVFTAFSFYISVQYYC